MNEQFLKKKLLTFCLCAAPAVGAELEGAVRTRSCSVPATLGAVTTCELPRSSPSQGLRTRRSAPARGQGVPRHSQQIQAAPR